jgi:hypothetical protein
MKMSDLIEIHDPAIAAEKIRQQIEQLVAQRQAENAYDPDVAYTGPEKLRHIIPEPVISPSDRSTVLSEAMMDLLMTGILEEPRFTSETPILGPLIIAFRRLWNWMSTKWYVLPLIWQQNNINLQTMFLLTELIKFHEVSAQKLAALEAKVESLETRLNGN